MRKYFNSVDYIVLVFSLLCLIWIIFYKLIWINEGPIFDNASKWADITYTVFTSILAAGFFYIVTIFLPKIKQIKDMKKGLIYYLDMIDVISNIIISKIKVGNTKSFYTVESIMTKYLSDKKIAENDFHNSWNNEDLHLLLKNIMNSQNDHIIAIMSNYSVILTGMLLKEIRDHISIYSNSLKNLPKNATLIKRNEESLRVLVHTTGIVNGLRETYKIKNEFPR